jgi:hypothetical protein
VLQAWWRYAINATLGTHFTCFTGTKVQILTQKALLEHLKRNRWSLTWGDMRVHLEQRRQYAKLYRLGSQFPRFTSTKVRILTRQKPLFIYIYIIYIYHI